MLRDSEGPIVAVTDFMKSVPDQIARFVPRPFTSLGTDGFGFSDTRSALRRHFEVDAPSVVVAVLHGLARDRRDQGRGRAGGHRPLRRRHRRAGSEAHVADRSCVEPV